MRRFSQLRAMLEAFALLLVLCGFLENWVWAQDTASGFFKVRGPCGMRFPKDHGAHEGYRTEWWYYTGNVRTETGRLFGFQLTFFRHQLSSEKDHTTQAKQAGPSSPWRTNQIFFAHAALSDVLEGRFRYEEKALRGAAGVAGVEATQKTVAVWVHPWRAHIGPKHHGLRAEARHFALDLRLEPQKPVVLHGIEGYSLKGSDPERASCYYSLTRLKAQGTVRVKDETYDVTGFAWMDHEYSSEPLEPGLQGWDWFGLQLDDTTELMVFGLRQKDGSWHPASSGTFVQASGTTHHLGRDEILLDVIATWKSPRSKATYPAQWRLKVPKLALELEIRPNLADQELETGSSTGVTYWEGSVSCRGTRQGHSVQGLGYVELTGYARPFDAPL
ncbi:lipocalin-like domain-containing protein [Desulfosoma caldarium]|uniref:Putative secreted hydrolase n=1 Tax=Desulfosoma caldarium TaxID=610254 RepID=A0A3N1VG80_9BACT|nr:lipocalin-like domain-containing protein [Desulfosoma caldarium]ROR01846.1 putative secreted hydrolase [Desulfosoma caldarium]